MFLWHCICCGLHLCTQGFELRASVWLLKGKEADSTAGVSLGIFIERMDDWCSLDRPLVFPVEYKGWIENFDFMKMSADWTVPKSLTGFRGLGSSDPLDVGPITSTKPLEPYMTDGELCVQLEIQDLDGMREVDRSSAAHTTRVVDYSGLGVRRMW